MAAGDQLKAGTPYDRAGSMAGAIEAALDELLRARGRPSLAASGPEAEYMRVLLVAVAQGVVNHLVDNPGAFATTSDGDPKHTHEIASIQWAGQRLGGS